MNGIENLIKALAMQSPPATPKARVYKLFYNTETTEVEFYTSSDEDVGTFIVITKEEYEAHRNDIRVIGGKIVVVNENTIGKLVPSVTGYPTLVNDASIVGDGQYWEMKTYE